MKQVILFPLGSLSDKDREALKEAGYIPIEVKDPKKVVIPMPSDVSGNLLLGAAMDAMDRPESVGERARFTHMLTKRLRDAKII